MSHPDTSREILLNLSEWIERRKDSIGPYADHIVHSVRHYEAEITRLREGRDQAKQQLAAARNDALAEMSRMIKAAILGGKVGAGDGNTHYLRTISTGEVVNIEIALRAQAAPTSEQKSHEIWPAPFHEGFWAIVDENGAIQEGAYGWAISPDSEVGAWERLLEPCQDWSVRRAKENGYRAAFFPAPGYLQKAQTTKDTQTAAFNQGLEKAAAYHDETAAILEPDDVQEGGNIKGAIKLAARHRRYAKEIRNLMTQEEQSDE